MKALDAGIDQFGGESAADLVVELVEPGEISEQRVDVSARRILRQKFALGLFDKPYVDVGMVSQKVGSAASRQLGHDSRMRAMTLLKNGNGGPSLKLPVKTDRPKVYVEGISADAIASFADAVASPSDADFAILRINTPWYPVDTENPFA